MSQLDVSVSALGGSISDVIRKVVRKRCYVIPVTEEIAVEAAKYKRRVKWSRVDSIIYATARRENAEVLTGNSDFLNLNNVIFTGLY